MSATPDLTASAQRVIADLKELAALTGDANGAQRVAWGPIWRKARDWFRQGGGSVRTFVQ